MKKNVDREILKYMKKKPQGIIIQNLVNDLDYHRFTIQKGLYRLIIRGLVEEIIYTQNCKVYKLK